MIELVGRRVRLRPLRAGDFEAFRAVRSGSRDWLAQWEPRAAPGSRDATDDERAFRSYVAERDAERDAGTDFSFVLLVGEMLAGCVNLRSIERGAFQSARLGYWIGRDHAGRGYVPEGVVLVVRFAFEHLGLHRVEANVIPRNRPSRRVMEKLGFREEGLARFYLEINGVWEDHLRYAMTAEDWVARRDELVAGWLA